MTTRWRVQAAIGRQLRHPSGFGGFLIGRLLAAVNRASNRIAVDALAPVADDTIVELGCGPGRALAALAARAANGRVLGIDHSAIMLAQAFGHNRQAIGAGRVHLLRGRLDALPLASDSVDKLVAVHVVYFADASAVREARRVLRPGGRLVMVATDRPAMQRYGFDRLSTHRIYDLDGLAALLIAGGFSADELALSKLSLTPHMPGLLAVATKVTATDVTATKPYANTAKRSRG